MKQTLFKTILNSEEIILIKFNHIKFIHHLKFSGIIQVMEKKMAKKKKYSILA